MAHRRISFQGESHLRSKAHYMYSSNLPRLFPMDRDKVWIKWSRHNEGSDEVDTNEPVRKLCSRWFEGITSKALEPQHSQGGKCDGNGLLNT
jgi:hypothetical protein